MPPQRRKRKLGKPRNSRQEDILAIFAEAQRMVGIGFDRESDDDGPVLSPGLIYCPEWRALNTRGGFGPWYGPRNQAELAVLIARYNSSVHAIRVKGAAGGGLWDYGLDPPEIVKACKKRAGREDADAVRRYVMGHSGDIPNRELEAYILYFEQGCSASETAQRMGLANRHVAMNLISDLRKKIKAMTPPKLVIGRRPSKH